MSEVATRIPQPGTPYIPGDETASGQPAPIVVAGKPNPNLGAEVGGGGTSSSATTSSPSGGGSPAETAPFDSGQFAADWYKAFFSSYGLPSDLQGQILNILKTYAADPATAVALAQQLLRTSQWYQQTFPGFNQGVANGLFTDETGYRSYLNNVNQLFNQYLGRHVTSNELSGYIASGYAPSYVGNLLQGKAWASANAQNVGQLTGAFGDNGQLSAADLGTLGNEEAGIDTAGGQAFQAMIARAQQRLSTIFSGKLAGPAGLTLGATGLSASGLSGGKVTPDVTA